MLAFSCLFTVCLSLSCGDGAPEFLPNRSHISLSDALEGHWKSDAFLDAKHEYFELIPSDTPSKSGTLPSAYFKVSWETGVGEKSEGQILTFFHEIDEKNNMVYLTHKSDDGVYTYINRYTFNPDRNKYTLEAVEKATKKGTYKSFDDIKDHFTYVNSQKKAGHID